MAENVPKKLPYAKAGSPNSPLGSLSMPNLFSTTHKDNRIGPTSTLTKRFDRFEHYGRLVVSDFRLRNLTGGTDKRIYLIGKVLTPTLAAEVSADTGNKSVKLQEFFVIQEEQKLVTQAPTKNINRTRNAKTFGLESATIVANAVHHYWASTSQTGARKGKNKGIGKSKSMGRNKHLRQTISEGVQPDKRTSFDFKNVSMEASHLMVEVWQQTSIFVKDKLLSSFVLRIGSVLPSLLRVAHGSSADTRVTLVSCQSKSFGPFSAPHPTDTNRRRGKDNNAMAGGGHLDVLCRREDRHCVDVSAWWLCRGEGVVDGECYMRLRFFTMKDTTGAMDKSTGLQPGLKYRQRSSTEVPTGSENMLTSPLSPSPFTPGSLSVRSPRSPPAIAETPSVRRCDPQGFNVAGEWVRWCEDHTYNVCRQYRQLQHWRRLDADDPVAAVRGRYATLSKRLLRSAEEELRVGRYLWRGVPMRYRQHMYLSCTDSYSKRERSGGGKHYESLCASAKQKVDPEVLAQVERDLHRTFPPSTHDTVLNSPGGMAMLRRVLTAYALRNKILGYCQSLNFVAAFLICHFKEEAAFWLTVAMAEVISPGYYVCSMQGLLMDMEVLQHLISDFFPAMAKHLEDNHVMVSLFATKLFLQAFVGCLPTDTLLRLLDLLYFFGSSILLAAVMAVLRIGEVQLLESEGLAFRDAFENVCANLFDADHFIQTLECELGLFEGELERRREQAREAILAQVEQVRKTAVMELVERAVEFEDLYQKFEAHSGRGSGGIVDYRRLRRENFRSLIAEVFPDLSVEWGEKDAFTFFDFNHDGYVDVKEFIVGASILLPGTDVQQKIKICFKAFDTRRLHRLNMLEVREMLEWIRKFCSLRPQHSPAKTPGGIRHRSSIRVTVNNALEMMSNKNWEKLLALAVERSSRSSKLAHDHSEAEAKRVKAEGGQWSESRRKQTEKKFLSRLKPHLVELSEGELLQLVQEDALNDLSVGIKAMELPPTAHTPFRTPSSSCSVYSPLNTTPFHRQIFASPGSHAQMRKSISNGDYDYSSMSEDSDSPSDYSDYSDPEPTHGVPELTLGVTTVTPRGDKNAAFKDLSIILPKSVSPLSPALENDRKKFFPPTPPDGQKSQGSSNPMRRSIRLLMSQHGMSRTEAQQHVDHHGAKQMMKVFRRQRLSRSRSFSNSPRVSGALPSLVTSLDNGQIDASPVPGQTDASPVPSPVPILELSAALSSSPDVTPKHKPGPNPSHFSTPKPRPNIPKRRGKPPPIPTPSPTPPPRPSPTPPPRRGDNPSPISTPTPPTSNLQRGVDAATPTPPVDASTPTPPVDASTPSTPSPSTQPPRISRTATDLLEFSESDSDSDPNNSMPTPRSAAKGQRLIRDTSKQNVFQI